MTAHDRAIVRDRANLSRLHRQDWYALTPDQRARVVAVLDEEK